MLGRSGIGRYIEQVVPRVFAGSELTGSLLGDVDLMRRQEFGGAESTLISCTSSIYSAQEQIELWRATPAYTDLFWSPHYNIPLAIRTKVVVTIHDVLHVARPEFVGGAHRRLYAKAMLQAVKRKAAAILCDSQFTADELMRLVGIPASSIQVIALGVEERCFQVGTDGPPQHRPYFLFVGNVKPHKNLQRLLQAFSGLTDELPHDLIIVGQKEGFLGGDTRVMEDAMKLAGRVQFTGHIADDEVHRYVSHAEALVLPSMYEGFGLPALEAMAAGCPVIVSRVASLPEVCGDAAEYVDPYRLESIAAGMRRVAENAELRSELREKGLARAGRFSWDRCAAETREVILGLL